MNPKSVGVENYINYFELVEIPEEEFDLENDSLRL